VGTLRTFLPHAFEWRLGSREVKFVREQAPLKRASMPTSLNLRAVSEEILSALTMLDIVL
jgi:hypothetical protein